MSPSPRGCCTDDHSRDDTLRDIMTLGFSGRLWWMAGLFWVYVVAFTAVAVLAAVMFFRVDAVGDKVLYAAIFVTAAMFVSVTKMWYWMLANRNSIKRDIRRLAEKIDQVKPE